MTEGISNNLNAHYSMKTKVERPMNVVANPSSYVPQHHVYTDYEATQKWNSLNQEINGQVMSSNPKPKKKSKSSETIKKLEHGESQNKKFWTIYLGFVGAVLALIGGRKLFKFFKKS